jgi:hypothetical protein
LKYRERISADLHANLDEKPHQSPLDRLLAFSYTPEKLSTALWRLKYDRDMWVYPYCVRALSERLRLRRREAIILVELALHEWLHGLCKTCHGAKEIVAGQKRVVCSDCKGVGVRRFSDEERSELTGLDIATVRKKSRLLKAISDEIDKAERQTNAVMTLKLEG